MSKTNAIRIAEQAGIGFDVTNYEVTEDGLDAGTVATKIGADPDEVFKTLVARNNENTILVFVIPGNYELDLKKAASVSGSKKVEMIHLKELLPLTGYIRGGCSPVGMKKSYPTFIDESAKMFDRIFVSAGVRGTQIHINPDDLAGLISGKFTDLI